MADVRACALGCSRGGLTTRLPALTDARVLPVILHLTPGQAHDGKTGLALIGTHGPGLRLLADASYDMVTLRDGMVAWAATAQIKPLARRRPTLALDNTACRRCNRIERLLSKFKNLKSIPTRHGKQDANFLNLFRLASVRIWVASQCFGGL